MRKKTSTIIGLAIATILTAYISTLTMSNQAFAQSGPHPPDRGPHIGQFGCPPCCPDNGCGGPIVAHGNDNSQGNEAGGGGGTPTGAAGGLGGGHIGGHGGN